VGVHSIAVRRGCGGTGCHQDAAVLSLPLNRAVCVSCHRDRVRHGPGDDCADRHAVRPQTRAQVGGT